MCLNLVFVIKMLNINNDQKTETKKNHNAKEPKQWDSKKVLI